MAKWNFPTDPRSKRGALGPTGLGAIAVNKENIFLPFLGSWEPWAQASPAVWGSWCYQRNADNTSDRWNDFLIELSQA